jgi:ketosteroid isomerase-like protein
MRTTSCLPCCLLLACAWPLQAQQTTVKDKALTNGESASQKAPGIRTAHRVATVRAEDQLIQLEKRWAVAGVKGDAGFFERIAGADYVIVDCDGSVRNKQQEIANFRQEAQTSQTVEDLKVRVYEGSAVVVGKFTIAGTYAGQPNNLSGSFTDVWIRHNRTWQLVSTQNTCKAAESAQYANPAVDKTETAKGDAEKELIQLEKQRVEEELKGLENEAVQAELRADMPAIDRIFSDDWIIVDEEAQVRNKKAEFEPFKTGEEKVTAGRLDDMSVRLFGEAAVVIGRYMFEGSFQGKPFDIKGRFTDVWARRNGRWQIVSGQNTAIPEANATEFPPDPFFIANEKEIWEALKRKDKSAATRLLADDFVGMYGFGFFSKSEWVKQIDEQYTVDDYTIENAKVLHPSANTALLLYNSNCKGTGTWTEFCSHASRISDFFVKRNGQWVALFSQDTD